MPQPETLAPVAPFSRSELVRGQAEPLAEPRRPARLRRLGRRDFLAGRTGRSTAAEDYWIRVHRRAMACRFEITLASQHAAWVPAARTALDTIDCLEAGLSVFKEDSAISRLNRRAALRDEGDGLEVAVEIPVEVDEDLFRLLERCHDLHRDTGGAFDITSTPLSRCWGFLQRQGRVPSAAAIDAARARVGFDRVALDPARRTTRFEHSGIELNLGAIGKGYALDCVAVEMRRAGVTDALLSAGRSSLLAIGGGARGWDVEVVSARATQEGAPRPLARLRLRDVALGTSGAGEQFVIADGTRYGHVIDPRTGWPASGVLSASVVTASAADADALSTAFLVGGLELAERYCADHPGVLALVTPDDGSEVPWVIGKVEGVFVQTPTGAPAARARREVAARERVGVGPRER
jgi:FAD:protein FMN transferase